MDVVSLSGASLAQLFNRVGKTVLEGTPFDVAKLGPCFIDKLPPELLEIILIEFVFLGPPQGAQHRVATLLLVSKEWNALSERLSCISISFIPRGYGQNTKRLMEELRRKMGSGRYAPCRSLDIRSTKSKIAYPLDGEPYVELLKFVGSNLWRLDVHGDSHQFFSTYHQLPTVNLNPTPKFTVPFLRELHVDELWWPTIVLYLNAVPHDRPLVLTLHHDFEEENEQHLFSIPIYELAGCDPHLDSDVGDQTVRYFDLYLARRSHFAQLVESLASTGRMTDDLRNRIKVLKVWFKGGVESIPELDFVFQKNQWASFVQWNARRPPSGESFCDPTVCKRLYACACRQQTTPR